MPNKIEETIDGVLYIYVIEPDTMTATLEEHVP